METIEAIGGQNAQILKCCRHRMKLERMEQDNVGTRMQHVMPCGIQLFFIQFKLYIFYMVCAIQTFTCRYLRLLQQPLLPFYPLES